MTPIAVYLGSTRILVTQEPKDSLRIPLSDSLLEGIFAIHLYGPCRHLGGSSVAAYPLSSPQLTAVDSSHEALTCFGTRMAAHSPGISFAPSLEVDRAPE